jgi:hypothetical protein
MLVMSLLMGLSTKQVDYTAAFLHADIDRDPEWDTMTAEEPTQSGVYLEMPKGFQTPGNVLKLKKSLYGLKQSLRNFFLHIKEKLEKCGFEQSMADQCLCISGTIVCLVYAENMMEDINVAIKAIEEAGGMHLEVEDDVAGFLES